MADAVEGAAAADAYAAKGDLVAGDGSGNPARLAVGADGAFLVADSTQAVGLAWRTPVAVAKKLGDQSIATTGLTAVGDLTFPVAANTDYGFEFWLVFQGSATSTGVKVAISVATATITYLVYETNVPRANASAGTDNVATLQFQASGGTHAETALAAANTNYLARLVGVLSVGGTAGTISLSAAANAAGTLIAKKGSQARLW